MTGTAPARSLKPRCAVWHGCTRQITHAAICGVFGRAKRLPASSSIPYRYRGEQLELAYVLPFCFA